MLDEVKRVLSTIHFRDLSILEPGRRGLVCSECRIYESHGELEVRFVRGTPYSSRQRVLERLSEAALPHTEGADL